MFPLSTGTKRPIADNLSVRIYYNVSRKIADPSVFPDRSAIVECSMHLWAVTNHSVLRGESHHDI